MNKRPIIGVSACLLGREVRFDGGHKRQRYITDTLAKHFDLQAVCPEVELGLGVPRPTLQLRRATEETSRLVNPRSGEDLTLPMQQFAAGRVANLGTLDGFILKKDSPSCGLHRVPVVVNDSGYRERNGIGLFAQALTEAWPLLPVEEEGRLNDAAIRENFFERLFAWRRWRAIENPTLNVHGFISFHTRHKFQLMARGAHHYQALGRMVAGTTPATLVENRDAYIREFMKVMTLRPDRGRQVNVLQHLMGYLKRELDGDDKQELLTLFERYRRNEIPLITPLTLLRHHLRRRPESYLASQHYLAPFPEALALRSFVG